MKHYSIRFINPPCDNEQVRVNKEFTCEAALVKFYEKYLPINATAVKFFHDNMQFNPSWA